MSNNHNFYTRLKTIDNISQITDSANYVNIPPDWFIAITDIKGSTKAIEAGRYKDVNAVAAASIAAILNIVPYDIPFVFGGDGATILIPPNVVAEVRQSLIATYRLAQDFFQLDLRVGVIPVQDVLQTGHTIRIAKLHMSPNFQQAIFTGGGISQAENLLKNPTNEAKYLLRSNERGAANFKGFECRWNAIRSPYEEIISLIVQVTVPDENQSTQIYREVIHKIDDIYGDNHKRHPINLKNLRLAWNPLHLKTEAKIVHQTTHWRKLLKMAYGGFKGRIAIWFDIQNWGSYKELLAAATDNEKFDDTLRMIISGNKAQSQALREYLETKLQAGELVYGIHHSTHTLMTCIIFDYFGRQIHFVDGSDGGYALAALEMKAQLKALAS